MFNLSVYILLAILFSAVILAKKKLAFKAALLERERLFLEDGYKKLYADSVRLKDELRGLYLQLDETVAIYNTTNNICKSLDDNVVFGLFKEEIKKYLKVSDCVFLKDGQDTSSYTGYLNIPLEIDKNNSVNLLVSGVNESDREKLNILSQQFLLGLKRAMLYGKIQELAITDVLTAAFSRRYSLERMEDELQRSKNMKLHFSVLMIDVDHFKEFNDKYGHLVGDVVLRKIAAVIKDNIRQIDMLGRYGGEEFLVVLSETARQEASFVAERIRQAVENVLIDAYDEKLKTTISIGVAMFPNSALSVQGLIDKADKAMYLAKSSGRNRVNIYSEP